MKIGYIAPQFKGTSFNCPHCGILTHHTWFYHKHYHLVGNSYDKDIDPDLFTSICYVCGKLALWLNKKMIHPLESGIDEPNFDLNDECTKLYNEARQVYPYSKRASAALLRLCVQSLCQQLGTTIDDKNSLNDAIKELSANGLNLQIQQALDILRVVGNHAVHPGVIDIDDNDLDVSKLFIFVNLIAKTLISDVKEIELYFQMLPEKDLLSIEKRGK